MTLRDEQHPARAAFGEYWDGFDKTQEEDAAYRVALKAFLAGWDARDDRDREPADVGAVIRYWVVAPNGEGEGRAFLAIKGEAETRYWTVAGASVQKLWLDIMLLATRWERVA